MQTRYLIPLLTSAGALAAIALAAPASAEPESNLPNCTTVAGGEYTGTSTTECATPGNVQISATAPDVPAYPYPWDDEFYGSALIIGGGGHGGR